MPAADLVLVGGDVVTMDDRGGPAGSAARAVAVAGERIVAVGEERDVRPLVGPRTRVVELHGRTLLPGFTDAHVHPAMGGPQLLRCALFDLPRTPAAYLAAIAAYAVAHPELPWILGGGWSMEAFPGGTPTAAELDRVVPDRPVHLMNRDGHGAWVNSRALALAGIDRETPDPPDGRIERGPDGSPTGTLHEGASALVGRFAPPPTVEERARGIAAAQALLHRLGIVGWQDAWVTEPDLRAYRLLAERGELTGRAIACHWWERERGAEQIEELVERRRFGTLGRLEAGTVKVMQDGVIENGTAALLVPYLDGAGRETANRGIDFIEPAALAGHVARLDALGFQVHLHTLGDRAVRDALDAIAAARAANGPADRRHHLAHLQLVDPADLARFAPLGVTATIQPYWACLDDQMRDLTLPFLRPDRAALQYPFRSLLRAGATLAGGSDWSVSTPDVMRQVEVAVRRVSDEAPDRPPFLPEEALTLDEALRAFTRGSAFVSRRDAAAGSIEVGKLADLVVLDRDLRAGPVDGIRHARPLLTLVGGAPVHEAAGLEERPPS